MAANQGKDGKKHPKTCVSQFHTEPKDDISNGFGRQSSSSLMGNNSPPRRTTQQGKIMHRGGVEVYVDLTEKTPLCNSSCIYASLTRSFFVRGTSLSILREDSLAIENLRVEGQRREFVQDDGALLRVLEMAMILNKAETRLKQDLNELKNKYHKLKMKATKMENDFTDYKGKYQIHADILNDVG